jgi:hypothetical protein
MDFLVVQGAKKSTICVYRWCLMKIGRSRMTVPGRRLIVVFGVCRGVVFLNAAIIGNTRRGIQTDD